MGGGGRTITSTAAAPDPTAARLRLAVGALGWPQLPRVLQVGPPRPPGVLPEKAEGPQAASSIPPCPPWAPGATRGALRDGRTGIFNAR